MASREVQKRCQLVSERLSESFHIVDHDPSMAMYRLQEHVHKSVPVLVARKYDMMRLNATLQGAYYDVDNSIEAIRDMKQAVPTFDRILEMLRDSTFNKQQLDYEVAKAKAAESAQQKSLSK
uniref:BLOC-1-related complex subunit 7 n=1 Tax=Panagrellus redivivus TaxID=6233 RepID=A0A7E4VIM6_PANRE